MVTRVTSTSLLLGIRERDPQQWDRFVSLFTPLVYEWCRRAGVAERDSPDIVQEVFRAVSEKVDGFRRERPGDSFHGWLWGITRHKIQDHFRSLARRPATIGRSTAYGLLDKLPAEPPELWDEVNQRQDSQLVFRRVLELLRTDFETHTWQAFWRVVVDEQSVKEVAHELGMSVGAVHNAKYKVLRRLREEFAELM